VCSEYPGDFLRFIEMYSFVKPRRGSEIVDLMPKPVTIFDPWVRLKVDMSQIVTCAVMILFACCATAGAWSEDSPPEGIKFFEKKIQPLLKKPDPATSGRENALWR